MVARVEINETYTDGDDTFSATFWTDGTVWVNVPLSLAAGGKKKFFYRLYAEDDARAPRALPAEFAARTVILPVDLRIGINAHRTAERAINRIADEATHTANIQAEQDKSDAEIAASLNDPVFRNRLIRDEGNRRISLLLLGVDDIEDGRDELANLTRRESMFFGSRGNGGAPLTPTERAELANIKQKFTDVEAIRASQAALVAAGDKDFKDDSKWP